MIRKFETRILWDGQADEELSVLEFEIDASRYETSDVAVISCVLKTSKKSQWYQNDFVKSPWLTLQIRDINKSNCWNNIFEGRVDYIRRWYGKSNIEFECRDAISSLIDFRIQDGWTNYNSRDIFSIIAQKVGLEIDVEFPDQIDDKMCGQFWQIEHKRNLFLSQHRFQTGADIIFDIARDMSCDVYADGQKIMCRPIHGTPQKNDEIFDFREASCHGVLSSDVNLNKGIIVFFSSWDSRQRVSTHVYYDGNSFSQSIAEGNNKIYSFRTPGKRLEDLKRLARAKYNRLISHSVSSEISVPGLIGLRPRKFVALLLEGMTSYFSIERVVSHFSQQYGFIQNITVRKRVA
ncbi:hypothetical protein [Neokomagataea anthophila]|uniref:Uncharacterized protein n=1 Tax=Neokomagataea anthophila TaxID=2826925 RepID=A0ABS5E8U0_9PROT|nr:hypothetical protein [Neokomagataea anthophila]MBR0560332.1 hypothetical protein [Neokomagataea anthophila]